MDERKQQVSTEQGGETGTEGGDSVRVHVRVKEERQRNKKRMQKTDLGWLA